MLKHVFCIAALGIGTFATLSTFSNHAIAADMNDKATGGNLSHGDMKFVTNAAQGNMTEVKASEIALQKASDMEVKKFAQHMIDDHSHANAELKTIADSKGVMIPTDLDSSSQHEVDKLASDSGGDFDKDYVKAMVKDHKEAVDMFQKFAERGDDNDLKTFAAKTLPTLQEHYTMIQGIDGKIK